MQKPKYADDADAAIEPICTKIYYASRTHSQLSQVVHELEKLRIRLSPPSVIAVHETSSAHTTKSPTGGQVMKRKIEIVQDELDTSGEVPSSVDVRTVSLGSRRQLCINEKLKRKAGDLDEACRSLLSGKHTAYLLTTAV